MPESLIADRHSLFAIRFSPECLLAWRLCRCDWSFSGLPGTQSGERRMAKGEWRTAKPEPQKAFAAML